MKQINKKRKLCRIILFYTFQNLWFCFLSGFQRRRTKAGFEGRMPVLKKTEPKILKSTIINQFIPIWSRVEFILFFVLIACSPLSLAKEGDIHDILHAPDKKTLESVIENQKKLRFLKTLCQTQKEFSKIPWACYELQPFEKKHDPFCLKLSVKNLETSSLKKALALKSLSSLCRKHLDEKLKILNYRKSKKMLDTL